ncbi:general odorant-binding protein 56d-like [Sitodiplosis mosellana]|uniref:Odorant binding protein OBP20 n=1 Tax=Sitodiplosis mosellana TaxID=263140 RepID=X5FR16_9DIPT|nr:general odorant-binding protein 56d-like [Sitodiplosis mosellana]AHW83247.1 odorant binding protein OBP20 [Sitodiplosis mosellana]
MKIVLVLFSVVGLSFAALDIPDHLRAPLKTLRKACVAETGVEEKYIDESRHGHLSDAPGMGCYINCLMEHSGMVEEDGRIHFDDIMHLLTPETRETVIKVVNECQTKHGNTRCETAWMTVQCYYQVAPEDAELP